MTKSCKDCIYFSQSPKAGEAEQGFCRKQPPKVFVIPTSFGPSALASWPPVKHDEWCGQYDAPGIELDRNAK